MRKLIIWSLTGCSLLLFTLGASAQNAGQQIESPYYSQDQYQNTHSMFDKIRADLYAAQTNAYPNYLGDGARFDVARIELQRLETNWDDAHYDSRQMDNTVDAIQMILNDNRLMGHDRAVLSADLSRLLDFRSEYY